MNTPVFTSSLLSDCRAALTKFWGEALAVETTKNGVVMALPLMLPDGLKVVVHLTPVSATTALLSDRGETLGRLAGHGLNLDAAAVAELLEERLALFELERDGWTLQKAIRLPVDGVDIQIFGEALVSLAHLIYRHEPEPASEAVADRTVRRFFEQNSLEPKRRHALAGSLERRIVIDYYLGQGPGLAVQVVNRRHQLLPYMEQWGWRWTDLRQQHPHLVRAMVYDPDSQPWDETSLRIGKSVCEVFCPYHETSRLGEALQRLG